MSKDHIAFFKRQVSLTEWFNEVNPAESAAFRDEDNPKRERLGIVSKIIGLPYDKPASFPATAVFEDDPAFTAFVKEHGDELCAVRIIPKDPNDPKLRMRGHTVTDGITWCKEQDIDPKKYTVDIVPHAEDKEWATVFVLNQHGAFGEITSGDHSELTQGYYEHESPIVFEWDFQKWTFSREASGAKEHLEKIMQYLKVADADKRKALQQEVNATFAHNYLEGYFETTSHYSTGVWFIDYNRILGKTFSNITSVIGSNAHEDNLHGRTGSGGKAQGKVRIVRDEDLASTQLTNQEVLVCVMTSPEYVPLMQQAAAIVTDLGGVLSHAAIIARELKKPCIVGTRTATTSLKEGQYIEVDADNGIVTIL